MVTHTFLPLLKINGGAIINLSSVTGPIVADPGEVAYATSKAAVLGFTKSLAAELVSDRIRVNAIMPGYVKTPMVEGMAKESNGDNPTSVVDGIAKAIPMRRLAEPEEIGELAAFLASQESSYITGQERALFKIKESDTLETTLYYQDQTNYYLYGLDEVEVTYQNEKKSLKEFLEDGTTIDTLVQDGKNEELSDSIGTLYYVGEANILVCHKNNENSINNNVYIGNKDMKYEEEFCRGE